MVTIYEHPLSPYAQKVKIALREKGVPFEVAGAGGAPLDFARVNPRAGVPRAGGRRRGDLRFHDHPRIHRGQVAHAVPAPTDAHGPRTGADDRRGHGHPLRSDPLPGPGQIGWFKRATRRSSLKDPARQRSEADAKATTAGSEQACRNSDLVQRRLAFGWATSPSFPTSPPPWSSATTQWKARCWRHGSPK